MLSVLVFTGLWIVGTVLFCLILAGASLGRTVEEQYQEDELQMRELSKKKRDRRT